MSAGRWVSRVIIRFYLAAGACEKIDSLKALLKIAGLSLFMVYAGDYLSLRYRIPKNRDPLGTVEIEVYYAVGLKNHKVEYMRADPETQTCARSLFPQMGYLPCWYLNRHRRKWIEIGRLHDIQVEAFSSISSHDVSRRANRRFAANRTSALPGWLGVGPVPALARWAIIWRPFSGLAQRRKR